MEDIKMLNKFIRKQESENTKIAYKKDIEQMLEYIGKSEIDINLADLEDWKVELKEKSLSKYTQNRKITAVRSYFNYLFECDYIDKNLGAKLKCVKIRNESNYTDQIALSKEQIQMMMNGCKNSRDRAIVSLYVNTGLRVSELINLKLDQCMKNEIHIVRKGDKFGTTYINESVRKYLDEYLKDRKDGCDNLFVSNSHKPMNRKALSNTLKCVAIRGGIDEETANKISNHTMRRTTATIMNDRGESLITIQNVLGHSSSKITERYIKNGQDQARVAVMTPVF